MPHIRPMYAASNQELDELLTKNKTELRLTLAYWLMYKPGEVAWIPYLLSEAEVERSENILPLEFVIDTGGAHPVNDEKVSYMIHGLLKDCPYLRQIHFGVWVRSMASNGFVEHDPNKK